MASTSTRWLALAAALLLASACSTEPALDGPVMVTGAGVGGDGRVGADGNGADAGGGAAEDGGSSADTGGNGEDTTIVDADPSDSAAVDGGSADGGEDGVVPDSNLADSGAIDSATIVDAELSDGADVDGVAVDAGSADGGVDGVVTDMGGVDGATADSGTVDSGTADSAPVDSGTVDSAPVDSAPVDSGTADSGTVDSAPADSAPVDSGTADSGPADSGTSDANKPDTTPAPVCGDTVCAAGEACPFDCSATAKANAACAQSKCPGSLAACQKDAGCVAALNTVLACLDGCQPDQWLCKSACDAKIGGNPAALAFGACMSAFGCNDPPSNKPCGDGVCAAGESAQSCPADCKAPAEFCGDGKCHWSESGWSCPLDCSEDGKKAWACVQKTCPNETAACLGEAACIAALDDVGKCALACDEKLPCILGCESKVSGNAKAKAVLVCGGVCFL